MALVRGSNVGGDAAGLRERLAATVDGEIGFDPGTRALYTADASIYRRVPVGVVLPRSVDGVIAAVAAAREFDVPVVVRGAGTSVAGQATGTRPGTRPVRDPNPVGARHPVGPT